MNNIYKKISSSEILLNVKKSIFSFSETEWKIFLSLLLLLLISTALILQNINNNLSVFVPIKGGTLNEGIIGTPRFINPVLATTDVDKDLSSLIYSGLMKKDTQGFMIPDLAEKLEISKDGLNYTFVLKENIYFHDGEKLDSEDVVFTISQIKDSTNKSPIKPKWDGVNINATDEKTIVFTLTRKYASFLENTTFGILPKHIWENTAIELNKANENPIGSGPYKVKKLIKQNSGVAKSYELIAFNKYINKEPYIQKFNLKFYNNEEELIKALENKDVDQISSISPDKALVLKNKGFNLETKILPRIFGIFFNQNENQIFIDKNILKAINLAIDKDKIVNEVLLGYGIAIEDPILPNNIAYDYLTNNTKISNEDNIKKAEDLLAKSNWKKNEEGFLQKEVTENNKKTKKILEFSISTSSAPDLVNTANMIKQDLEKIGIKVEIKTFDIGNLNQSVIKPRSYDALLFGQVINTEADLFAFWHSSQRTDPGLNIAMYTNPKVDKILEDAFVTIDEKERSRKYAQFGEEIKKDQPAVFLYSPSFVYVVSKDLKGFDANNIINSQERFKNIKDWYLKTEKVWKIFTNLNY